LVVYTKVWTHLNFRQTPLDIVATAIGSYSVNGQIAGDVFSAYDEFLGLVADPTNREHLKRLRAEDSREDLVFQRVQEFGQRFEDALRRIFFENSYLKPLTQKYGVF